MRLSSAFLIAALCAPATVQAASLQVSPVTVDIPANGATGTLTLRNRGDVPITVQIRPYRWRQAEMEDVVEPTDAVAVSPPFVALKPKQDYVVRVVSLSKTARDTEESYRLLVDELPDASAQRSGMVNLVLRYSIPVFFGGSADSQERLAWSVKRSGPALTLIANNEGGRRVRLSQLVLRDAQGKALSLGQGLNGYVLGHSARLWRAAIPAGFSAQGSLSVTALGDTGPVKASASVEASR